LAIALCGCGNSDSQPDQGGTKDTSSTESHSSTGNASHDATSSTTGSTGQGSTSGDSSTTTRPDQTGETDSQQSPARPVREPKPIIEMKEPEAPPAKKPSVALSESHEATCLIKVGQAFPDATLPNSAGDPTPLSELRGDQLTVVFLFNSPGASTVEALSDLAVDVAAPWAEQGVGVVAIGVKQDATAVGELMKTAQAEFPLLLDADGAFFAQLATEMLPRVYLLDAQGKVLWLDVEYSLSTHLDLVEALRYYAEDTGPAKSDADADDNSDDDADAGETSQPETSQTDATDGAPETPPNP
jgi:peroxiredoxin